MGLGMFDTCDNSLMVYIFGPQKSRPFTQSVHSFVGAGFVAGILLAGPFLPEQKTQSGDVCPNTDINDTSPNHLSIFPDPKTEVKLHRIYCFSTLWYSAELDTPVKSSEVTAPNLL